MIIKITGNKHQNTFFQSFSLVSHHKIIPIRDKYGSCVFLAMGFPHRICYDLCGWPHLVSTNRKWIIEWKKNVILYTAQRYVENNSNNSLEDTINLLHLCWHSS